VQWRFAKRHCTPKLSFGKFLKKTSNTKNFYLFISPLEAYRADFSFSMLAA